VFIAKELEWVHFAGNGQVSEARACIYMAKQSVQIQSQDLAQDLAWEMSCAVAVSKAQRLTFLLS
jgi:hypothetical protein